MAIELGIDLGPPVKAIPPRVYELNNKCFHSRTNNALKQGKHAASSQSVKLAKVGT